MSTEEKELEVTSTEAPKKPARKPRKPVDPAVWEELKAMQESGDPSRHNFTFIVTT